jgi:23S rRNA (uridine2552-2'-O)-methyltransferase
MARSKWSDDHYSQRARREGRPARSIYKLEEIDQRWRLLKRGDRVLDLGCAPGSWSQYAGERVGANGLVIGYDLQPVRLACPPHVQFRQADVFGLSAADVGGSVDVLLSDMAPSTMGDHATDALRSSSLVERALVLADELLIPGGNMVAKILEGPGTEEVAVAMRQRFARLTRLRPKATRQHSTELFLIGLGKRTGKLDS